MKSSLPIFLAALLTALPATAEQVSASPAALAAERAATVSANEAAKQNNAALAEQLLIAANRARPNTSWWHVETAQRLIQLAYDVPREGRSSVIPTIVASALQHLATAESLASSPAQKASIKVLAGRIHERYVGDHAAALLSYRAALALSPDNPQAKAESSRMQGMLDHAARRAARN